MRNIFLHSKMLSTIIMKTNKDNTLNKVVRISSIRSAIGGIPVIGTLLNEALFDGRSRLKQARINKFILLLQEYIEQTNEEEINVEYLKSEEFSDLFESILKRVVLARSEKKLKIFKQILIGQFENNSAVHQM
jgi:hypothetical protein